MASFPLKVGTKQFPPFLCSTIPINIYQMNDCWCVRTTICQRWNDRKRNNSFHGLIFMTPHSFTSWFWSSERHFSVFFLDVWEMFFRWPEENETVDHKIFVCYFLVCENESVCECLDVFVSCYSGTLLSTKTRKNHNFNSIFKFSFFEMTEKMKSQEEEMFVHMDAARWRVVKGEHEKPHHHKWNEIKYFISGKNHIKLIFLLLGLWIFHPTT